MKWPRVDATVRSAGSSVVQRELSVRGSSVLSRSSS